MSEPKLAVDYRLHERGLDVDGLPFPWHVGLPGPRVEAIDEYHHFLWVPIMVLKPAPQVWDDRGESLEETK